MWIRGEWGAKIGRVESPKELHERYRYILYDTLKTLLEYPKSSVPPRCEACEKEKATKLPAPQSKVGPIRTTKPLEWIHCDLVGPIKPPMPAKQYQYLLVVIDDYSQYISGKPLHTKDETIDALIEIINYLEKASEYSVKNIQADWGGEFQNKNLQTELRQRGIQLKETVPRHSETNAVVEQANCTIFTMSRTALIAVEMPKGYWDKASLWAIYVKNWLPHKALPKGLTPVEILLPGTHAECLRNNLRPFEQRVKCFDYEVSDKLSARGYEGRIIDYTNTFQTYWVIDSSGKT